MIKQLLFIVFATITLLSCGNANNTIEQSMSLEEKLAILDANGAVDTTSIQVIRMRTLLNDIASMYSEPKDTIAEWTSKAQGVLHDKGIQETNLNILEEMNKAGKIENTPYRDAITLYAMMREKGQ